MRCEREGKPKLLPAPVIEINRRKWKYRKPAPSREAPEPKPKPVMAILRGAPGASVILPRRQLEFIVEKVLESIGENREQKRFARR